MHEPQFRYDVAVGALRRGVRILEEQLIRRLLMINDLEHSIARGIMAHRDEAHAPTEALAIHRQVTKPYMPTTLQLRACQPYNS